MRHAVPTSCKEESGIFAKASRAATCTSPASGHRSLCGFCAGCPRLAANYERTGFKAEPWTDSRDFGAWDAPLIFQYASTGRIPGYAGNLDLNLFYGTKDDWRGRCTVAGASAGNKEANANVIQLRIRPRHEDTPPVYKKAEIVEENA